MESILEPTRAGFSGENCKMSSVLPGSAGGGGSQMALLPSALLRVAKTAFHGLMRFFHSKQLFICAPIFPFFNLGLAGGSIFPLRPGSRSSPEAAVGGGGRAGPPREQGCGTAPRSQLGGVFCRLDHCSLPFLSCFWAEPCWVGCPEPPGAGWWW